MKNIYVIALTLIFISCNNVNSEQKTSYLIGYQLFKEMMSKENIVILDVRTPGEVEEGVIGAPLVINFNDDNFNDDNFNDDNFNDDNFNDDNFNDRITSLDKSKTYLVYCKGGGRSGKTKELMDVKGFKDVYDLKGGITAWKADGMPIE